MVDFKVKSGDLAKMRGPCVAVPVFAGRRLPEPALTIDRACKGAVTRWLERGDLDGSLEQTLMLHALPGLGCERLLLVGCGEEKELTLARYRKATAAAVAALARHRVTDLVWTLHGLNLADADGYRTARETLLTVADRTYSFDRLKTNTPEPPKRPLAGLIFWVPDRKKREGLGRAIRHGQAVANGVRLAKDLGNLPGNLCTPNDLADQARALAERFPRIKVQVLETQDMEQLGMGALLAVARGSRQPPKLIVLEYQGEEAKQRPVVLVGKGVTFDAGGISLKPGENMDEMKFDMSGAGSVLGTLNVCAELDLPLNLVGILPCAENLPDGLAVKPGDVITSLSGQTIEVLNTDAEGRLLLCDALTYGERYDPALVIDIATLTGACVVALGKVPSGLLSNSDDLAKELLAAGEHIGDRAWQLPLWDDYQSQLDSRFADMANIGGRPGGAITAACFLSRFTKKMRWAHLDIAGTAYLTGDQKGSTGRPVPLLSQFLLRRCDLLP